MADKKELADVIDFLEYKRMRARHALKRHLYWQTITPKDAYADLLDQFDNGMPMLGKTFLGFAQDYGYTIRSVDDKHMLCVREHEFGTRYISDCNFLTDKPDIATISLNPSESKILENRLELITSATPDDRHKTLMSLLRKSAAGGVLVTAGASIVFGVDYTIAAGLAGLSAALITYRILETKYLPTGMLPQSIAKHQVLASQNQRVFFVEAFGIDPLDFLGKEVYE